MRGEITHTRAWLTHQCPAQLQVDVVEMLSRAARHGRKLPDLVRTTTGGAHDEAVNALAPGLVDTEMTADLSQEWLDRAHRRHQQTPHGHPL